jgi:hypothetical protein
VVALVPLLLLPLLLLLLLLLLLIGLPPPPPPPQAATTSSSSALRMRYGKCGCQLNDCKGLTRGRIDRKSILPNLLRDSGWENGNTTNVVKWGQAQDDARHGPA